MLILLPKFALYLGLICCAAGFPILKTSNKVASVAQGQVYYFQVPSILFPQTYQVPIQYTNITYVTVPPTFVPTVAPTIAPVPTRPPTVAPITLPTIILPTVTLPTLAPIVTNATQVVNCAGLLGCSLLPLAYTQANNQYYNNQYYTWGWNQGWRNYWSTTSSCYFFWC